MLTRKGQERCGMSEIEGVGRGREEGKGVESMGRRRESQ